MTDKQLQPSPILQLTTSICRHWRLAVGVFTVIFGAAVAFAVLSSDKYQCQIKILVKNERANPLVGTDAHTTSIINLDQVNESRINSEIQLLTSTDVLRQVVERTGLAGAKHSDARAVNAAVRDLQAKLTIKAVKNSNIIEISVVAKRPQTALDIIRALSSIYLESHIRLLGSPGTYKVFEKQADEAQQALSRAEAELVAFRKQNKIVAVNDERNVALQQFAALHNQLLEAEAAAGQQGKQVATLQAQLKQMTPRVTKEIRTLSNQYSIERLNTLLVELRNKRTSLVSSYREDDRVIVALDQQIADTANALKNASTSKAVENTTDVNPLFQTTAAELNRAQAELSGTSARAKALSAEVNEARARLAKLDEISIAHERLARRAKELEDTYMSYVQQRNQARASEILDGNQVANVVIAEKPFLPDTPSSPNRPLILSLGVGWALVMATIALLIVSNTTTTFSSPAELEQATGLPVLATVPLHFGPSLNTAAATHTFLIEGSK
jgi:uncharacterized protein involved in exopolysaccharide biosynthesis